MEKNEYFEEKCRELEIKLKSILEKQRKKQREIIEKRDT